jgi:hypothetical protein
VLYIFFAYSETVFKNSGQCEIDIIKVMSIIKNNLKNSCLKQQESNCFIHAELFYIPTCYII